MSPDLLTEADARATTETVMGSPPLSLYAKAAIGSIPGTSMLPLIGGRQKDVPERELILSDVKVDLGKLASYSEVCGFRLREELPPTYPHVLAFPLQMALMTDRHFPFPAIGLVHISNRITQHRPIAVGERLEIRVSASKLEPHPKGRQFSLLTEVLVGTELVWEESSTNLRRGGSDESSGKSAKSGGSSHAEESLRAAAEWNLDGGLGRRYAAASGDRNPIHMHDLSAKAFGFPRAIAHGMWSKARCLAALEGQLPDAFTTEVAFKRPILLPAKVEFLTPLEGGVEAFALRSQRDGSPHLSGSVSTV
jgi:acyl dehydratase